MWVYLKFIKGRTLLQEVRLYCLSHIRAQKQARSLSADFLPKSCCPLWPPHPTACPVPPIWQQELPSELGMNKFSLVFCISFAFGKGFLNMKPNMKFFQPSLFHFFSFLPEQDEDEAHPFFPSRQHNAGDAGGNAHLCPFSSLHEITEWHWPAELMLECSPSKMFYGSAKH